MDIRTTMVQDQKVIDALQAMREMDIPDETTHRNLQKLLKLSKNNWALIEQDNFSRLADYIFESEEHKEQGAEKVEEVDLRAPLKELHPRHDWEASPSAAFSGLPPLKEQKLQKHLGDISSDATSKPSPRSYINGERTEHSQNHCKEKQNQSVSSPRTCYHQDFEELYHPSCRQTVSVSREKKSEAKRSSDMYLTNEKPTGVLNSMNVQPIVASAQFEVPLSVIHPSDSAPVRTEGLPIPNDFMGTQTLLEYRMPCNNSEEKCEDDGISDQQTCSTASLEHTNNPESHSSSFEIASSEIGQVKISLQFNYAHERPDFRVPNLDALFKMVEDKCIKSYKIVNPDFSIKKLMQDFCQSYLDAATERKIGKGKALVNGTPPLDVLKKSSVLPKANHVFKLTILESSVKSSLNSRAQIPRPISTDGLGLPTQIIQPKGKLLLTTKGEKDEEDIFSGSKPSSSESSMVLDQSEGTLDGTNPLGLVVHNQSKCTLDGSNSFHKVADISKGQERYKITVANEVCTELLPPSFHYIPRNLVYQNAYIQFPLARIGDENCCSSCDGDCLSSPVPCACAGETGGEFGYTVEGLVKKEFLDECMSLCRDPKKHSFVYCKECPLERSNDADLPDKCKGHLVRKFIKECWSKCGCHIQCGNRVVQRGISRELQVFFTREGKGWGIRALHKLPRGAFVCEYVGEVLTNTELYERNVRNTGNERHTYPVLLDADWGSEAVLKDDELLCLDATYYGNVARFVNHRCFDANLIDIPIEIESPDHHYYHVRMCNSIAFFTSREVAAMEELTWDYGIDFLDHNHPIKAFQCLCGSKGCRDIQHSTNSASRSNRHVLSR
ncbi:hypothetical protein C5167_002242 [Papaver somniferum]|uniref:SET domain-containing protein n=1 Tax=Papaver somniferum TaxID=3469 RepID=A0A4Y7L097_PAPSO|nr:hypothetical protein C5167_002242 [Papaver somniferum]